MAQIPSSQSGLPAGLARSRVGRRWTISVAVVLAMVPALSAPLLVPGFVTQDGPAHLYNAEILTQALRGSSEFAPYYQVRREPLPNWAGHLATMGMLALFPPTWADRLLIAATALGPALAFALLRRSVAGPESPWMTAAIAAMLGLNVTWLLGFTSFLLGVCLNSITLAYWWSRRDRMGPGPALGLGGLLALGYFCHLISLAITAAGLVVLCLLSPGPSRRRLGWTAAGLAPLFPLAGLYLSLTLRGGGEPLHPDWQYLSAPLSLRSWLGQFGWVDPISLGSKVVLPFVEAPSKFYAPLTPVIPFALAIILLVGSTLIRGRHDRRMISWGLLAALLCLGGLLSPDSFGEAHGNYLPQRVVLMGLVALLPWLDLAVDTPARVLAAALLALSLALQSATVWDYAIRSAQTAGLFQAESLREAVGRGQRIGTLVADTRTRSRANPLFHADNWLGLGTGNILWSNYETRHYYFPVQFRPELSRPPAYDFERVAIGTADPDFRDRLWRKLLDDHASVIDLLVVYGNDPRLDAINERLYQPVYAEGPLRVLRRRGPRGPLGPDQMPGELGPSGR